MKAYMTDTSVGLNQPKVSLCLQRMKLLRDQREPGREREGEGDKERVGEK